MSEVETLSYTEAQHSILRQEKSFPFYQGIVLQNYQRIAISTQYVLVEQNVWSYCAANAEYILFLKKILSFCGGASFPLFHAALWSERFLLGSALINQSCLTHGDTAICESALQTT